MRSHDGIGPVEPADMLSLIERAVLVVPTEQVTRFWQASRRAIGLRMYYEALDFGTARSAEGAEAGHYMNALRNAALLSCGDDLNAEQVLEVLTRYFERRLEVLHDMHRLEVLHDMHKPIVN